MLRPPYAQGDFGNENFPGAAQTQVTGLNDTGVTVGFFSTMNAADPANDNNIGFWRANGRYHSVSYPTRNNAMPSVNQLLGVNDRDTRSASTTTPRATPTATPTTSSPGGSR